MLQLANGQVLEVPPALIKRLKSHFTSLEGTGEPATQHYLLCSRLSGPALALALVLNPSQSEELRRYMHAPLPSHTTETLC